MHATTPTGKQNYTPNQIAEWWLKRNFCLIPAQPNSKRNVRGFGFYQDKITDVERFAVLHDEGLSNLAVCSTRTTGILDFDDPDLYTFIAHKFPKAFETYTERTPRGGYHVFVIVLAESLKGLFFVKGVELKTVALVAPSVIDGKPYIRGTGEILRMDAIVFSSLSRKPIIPQRAPRSIILASNAGNRLQRIKSSVRCLDVIQQFSPKTKVRVSNRFLSLRCPKHKDKHPSFWILPEKNLCGCHACGWRGDVVNLFAWLYGISNAEAIREMGKTL